MSYLNIYNDEDSYDIDLAQVYCGVTNWKLKLLNFLAIAGILALVLWDVFGRPTRSTTDDSLNAILRNHGCELKLDEKQQVYWWCPDEKAEPKKDQGYGFTFPDGVQLKCNNQAGSMECETDLN